MAQFAYVEHVHINNVDPTTNNITLECLGVLINGAQIVNFDLITAAFAPSVTGYVTNITTAVVNKFLSQFGTALPRTAVVMDQLTTGQ